MKAPFDTTLGQDVCIVPHMWRVMQKKPIPAMEKAWQLTEALLVRVRKATADAGSKLLVVNVPTAQSIYPSVLAEMKRKYGISDEEWRQGWRAEQPGILLADICQRNHIDCLDPTDRFKSEAPKLAREGRWLNFPIDGHWTPAAIGSWRTPSTNGSGNVTSNLTAPKTTTPGGLGPLFTHIFGPLWKPRLRGLGNPNGVPAPSPPAGGLRP